MEPASPLVLTQREHALIGELVEILGQVEDTMIETVARLLSVDRGIANKIMGSTNIEPKTAIWSSVIKSRNPEVSPLVAIAEKRLSSVSKIRNDFIHALFTPDYVEAGYVEPGYFTSSATRIKSGQSRPVSDIEEARESAAILSCLVAHIDHCTKASADREPSPWLERLGPLLQPHQPTQKASHQGKERRPPREPSQA